MVTVTWLTFSLYSVLKLTRFSIMFIVTGEEGTSVTGIVHYMAQCPTFARLGSHQANI